MATAAAAERLREYEIVYVLAPNADNTEAERINAKVSEVVANFNGKLTKLDNWGRRKLAYPIKRNTRGIFVYAKYIAKPGVVATTTVFIAPPPRRRRALSCSFCSTSCTVPTCATCCTSRNRSWRRRSVTQRPSFRTRSRGPATGREAEAESARRLADAGQCPSVA